MYRGETIDLSIVCASFKQDKDSSRGRGGGTGGITSIIESSTPWIDRRRRQTRETRSVRKADALRKKYDESNLLNAMSKSMKFAGLHKDRLRRADKNSVFISKDCVRANIAHDGTLAKPEGTPSASPISKVLLLRVASSYENSCILGSLTSRFGRSLARVGTRALPSLHSFSRCLTTSA
jgi:hypothetical protein